MNFPKPASHPRHCHVCNGTGWQPGPPIPATHHGKPFDYPTVEPCRHDWRDDNPDVDEHGWDRTQ